jgi:hypothetical protein
MTTARSSEGWYRYRGSDQDVQERTRVQRRIKRARRELRVEEGMKCEEWRRPVRIAGIRYDIECLLTKSWDLLWLDHDESLAQLLEPVPMGALVQIDYLGRGPQGKKFRVRWKPWDRLEKAQS